MNVLMTTAVVFISAYPSQEEIAFVAVQKADKGSVHPFLSLMQSSRPHNGSPLSV